MNDSLHEFEVQEGGLETDEITAACTCGWVGDRHPVDEGGYEEARDEYRLHVSGELLEQDQPS